jgi:hypothetical protein
MLDIRIFKLENRFLDVVLRLHRPLKTRVLLSITEILQLRRKGKMPNIWVRLDFIPPQYFLHFCLVYG